jgi:hypothetical protein
MVRRHLTSPRRAVAAACLALLSGQAALAQSQTPGGMPPPPGMSLTQSNAMRFPQPVRVGQLLGRVVLQPVESQNVLGHVRGVVRDGQGQVMVVIRFGGFLGFGSRLIAVPVDAMVLLGDAVEVAAFTPRQLRGFPTFTASGTTPVPTDTVVRIGLAKPSH